jgi:hypothetical protein
MDKSFLVYLFVGLGFIYLITHYVGDIQEDDNRYQNSEYTLKHKYDSYKSLDSIGREILNVSGADTKTQIGAWNEGSLKQEFLDLYPDFSLMKDFVKNRVSGEPLKSKLLKLIDNTETKFFSGTYTTEQAKHALESFK